LDAQRARTANRIIEQFEREDFSNGEVTKPHPLAQVAPVKEHGAAIGKADEPVPLPVH
jgi:hypothetical protein